MLCNSANVNLEIRLEMQLLLNGWDITFFEQLVRAHFFRKPPSLFGTRKYITVYAEIHY
jgi:hypothetical protein